MIIIYKSIVISPVYFIIILIFYYSKIIQINIYEVNNI